MGAARGARRAAAIAGPNLARRSLRTTPRRAGEGQRARRRPRGRVAAVASRALPLHPRRGRRVPPLTLARALAAARRRADALAARAGLARRVRV